MVQITLPYDDGNPQQWMANITDAELIIAIRNISAVEGLRTKLDDITIWVDDSEFGGELTSHRPPIAGKSAAVFTVGDLRDPLTIPYKLSISSPFGMELLVEVM